MSGAVLIGPPTPTAGGANLVLSSQPQFTPAPYPPYHTAAHLASSRPTLIAAHATPTALPPGSAFRPPTAAYAPLPHNGEILYPYAGGPTIAFLTTAAASPIVPGTQNLQQTMRSAAQTAQPPQQPPLIQQQPPQQQQPQPPQQQQQQKVPTAYTPPAVVTGVVPPPAATVPVPHPPGASTPTGSLYSPLSCFNCGSQKHTGLECQESSMEDVTRNSIYKLDYLSASAGGTTPVQPNVGPPSSSSPSLVVSSLPPSSAVVSPAAALSASVSVSRMSLVDTAKSQDAAEPSPSPVHHSTSSATATTLPLTPSQQSLVDASTSVSTQTINNQTDSSSSSTISK